MAKKVQVTLTGNEGKRLIAKAAVRMPEIQERLEKNKILLCGGTTVSALSEELGFGPLRISGRIDATRYISEIMPLDNLYDAIQLMKSGKANKVLIKPWMN